MDNLQSLDVAIGLVFVFLVLSLIVMAINEWIAQLIALRSTTLKEGNQQLLRDDTRDLAAELYNHSLIASLARQGRFDRLIGREAGPSYISARMFATALLDVLVGTGTDGGSRGIAEVSEAVSKLPDGAVKESLSAVFHQAEEELVHARHAIEAWFDDAMDRVSGQYKRRIQIVTILLAFLITALANVDAFAMTDHLVRTPAKRAAIVALAQETVKTPVEAPTPGEAQEIQLGQLLTQTEMLQLPLGWANTPTDATGWAGKALGLAITVAAVSLGAPFWFDVLSKIVRVRTTGPRPRSDDANLDA